MKVFDRGERNQCSRTDFIFQPLPDSNLAKHRERVRKASHSSSVAKEEKVSTHFPLTIELLFKNFVGHKCDISVYHSVTYEDDSPTTCESLQSFPYESFARVSPNIFFYFDWYSSISIIIYFVSGVSSLH